jgi:PHD/YefM family antitoxin component YafN of YafNO toxin-antitoxin module
MVGRTHPANQVGVEMAPKVRKKTPEIVLRDGKPAAVILDIESYQEMLERLEDVEDLKILTEQREKSLKFKKLEDFLEEYQPGV